MNLIGEVNMEVGAGMKLVKMSPGNLVGTICVNEKEEKLISEGFTFDFSQIQQNADFSSQLRDKFKLWLNAGKHLLEFGLSEQGIDFVPLTDNQKTLLHQKIDQLTTRNQQQSSLALVTGNKHNHNFTGNHMYQKYLDMLDALMEKMLSCQKQLDRYESFDDVTPTNTSSLTELVIAISHHNEVRQKLIVTEKKINNEESKLFSLGNQFELFLVEQSRGVEPETLEGYKSKFECLFEYIPASFDCREFGKTNVQEIKTALLSRPANAKKGITDNLMKAKTINSYLSNYRTFFEWLLENVDGVEKNPFSNVSIKKSDAEYIFRRPYTSAEIRKLMNYQPNHASEAKWFRDDAKWYIPVALYTGMRLNEIADIKLEEIKEIDGVWCFDLSNQDVKNKASQRTVPIAQYLLDIKLLDYINKLKGYGQTYLFYQIRKGRDEPGPDGWGEPISRWFNRTVLKKIGIDAVAEKLNKKSVVFHCIRHTFIGTCIKKGAQKHFVKRIVGHSDDDEITIGVYSDIKNTSMLLLKEVLDEHLTWHLAA